MSRLPALLAAALCAALAGAALPPPAAAQDPAALPLFRVILKDGTALASIGEYSRTGDRVVFSMPLGPVAGNRLQLMNLPADAVDWESTGRYAEAVRYARYIGTRAEMDYAELTGQVAAALNEIALARDPARRLAIAEQAQRLINAWPAQHFGYRSSDVREMSSLLDETISDLRAAAGVRQFDFNLVASVRAPSMPLLPSPSPAQTIEQAMIAARASDVPAERLSLLQAIVAILDEPESGLPPGWRRLARASAEATLKAEIEVERRYRSMSEALLRTSERAAARADVRGVERAIQALQRRDERFGHRRPDQVQAVLAALGDRLDAARRLRVMRDQWQLRARAFREYDDAIAEGLRQAEGLQPRLDDIRALAGPPVAELPALAARFDAVYRRLAAVKAPVELSGAHGTLLSSIDLALQAVRTRSRAAVSGDVKAAWDASAAASGAIMLLAQARQSVAALSRPPELK
jgi:hypothetical protein